MKHVGSALSENEVSSYYHQGIVFDFILVLL
jgi:hypothetical protein